ncbi:MAG: 50S ribosome-binding GTPase [Rickettsia sp.]|jgi:hypothetical protein|nr:50S ribosome-binding GTPase [Rickettsia sp.]
MAKEQKSSKITEAELNVRVVRLMERVNELIGKETVKEGKDIVAFVGPTKAGKSTLINCLLGNQLICKKDKDTEDTFIIKAPEILGPKIGEGGESETVKPKGYQNVPSTNYAMWDFAGFSDNKGTEQEIVNAISYQTILRPQNTVRFVLVAPCDLIKSANPLPFYKLLNELQQICPQIANSLCIVSTKAEKGSVKGFLEKAKSHLFSNAEKSNIDMINQSKKVIEEVLKNGSYVDFKAPELEEEVYEKAFTLPNKQQFIDCIKKLSGTKVTDFPLVISDQARYEIAELYTVYYQTIKREIDRTNCLIENYIQTKVNEVLEAQKEDGSPTDASARLALFKKGKNTITNIIEESQNFKKFFVQVKCIGIGIDEGFEKNIDEFIFIEKLKNMYKVKGVDKSVQGESEFFCNIKVAINNGAKKYSDLIATSAAATEEEKRKEQQWQKHYNDEKTALEERIKSLQKDNDSVLVKGAKWLSKTTDKVIDTIQDKVIDTIQDKCVISLVTDIDYDNPLLNNPLLLKSFSQLYGTKALSDLIGITQVLSVDSPNSVQEICDNPHALEMCATLIGLCCDS